jgi:hypothetical protein
MQESKAIQEAMKPYRPPVWLKYECTKGARWTAVKGGMCEEPSGVKCRFSGCTGNHHQRIVGETADRDEAHDWFNNPYSN